MSVLLQKKSLDMLILLFDLSSELSSSYITQRNRKSNNWFCLKCTSHLFPFNHFSDNEVINKVIMENSNQINLPVDALD